MQRIVGRKKIGIVVRDDRIEGGGIAYAVFAIFVVRIRSDKIIIFDRAGRGDVDEATEFGYVFCVVFVALFDKKIISLAFRRPQRNARFFAEKKLLFDVVF